MQPERRRLLQIEKNDVILSCSRCTAAIARGANTCHASQGAVDIGDERDRLMAPSVVPVMMSIPLAEATMTAELP